MTAPSTPSRLWLFVLLRFALPPERDELFFERDALARVRVDADDFERGEPPPERDELRGAPPALREDPLPFVLGPELFDAPPLLFVLREADLLLAIRISL